MYSGLRRLAISRKTPPCGLPRPAFTSLLIARATSSRGSRFGVRRLLRLSSYQRSASSIVSAVSAAKNGGKNLYVQTRDAKISLEDTVSLVSTGEASSHVAVIQGQAHVEQNGTSTKLGPGEQVATSLLVAPRSMADERDST